MFYTSDSPSLSNHLTFFKKSGKTENPDILPSPYEVEALGENSGCVRHRARSQAEL